MTLAIAGHTDRGGRAHNEDAIDWLCDAAGRCGLALVADGMGGYAGGEVASALALEVFVYELQPAGLANLDTDSLLERLLASGRAAHNRLLAEQRAQPALARMGTTLLAGYFQGDHLALLHVGDSRCYRLRAGQLSRLTRDHTFAEECPDQGMDPHERRANRHVLTRALGARAPFDFSLAVHLTQPGDLYVFCSDGLSNSLQAHDWRACLARPGSPEMKARALVDRARARAADDNVSAVVVAV